MTTIRERIIENRPNLTLSSIKTYMSIINKTARDISNKLEKPDDIIEHHKEILESLMTYKPNIRKTKLSAFIVVLDQKDDTPDDVKEIIDNYRKQLFADADDVDKDEKKQKLTESQEKNYITWDEVLKIYDNLRTEAEPLFKLENLNKKQYNKLQEFVLLSLYVLTPPRRSLDYAQFKIKSIDESTDNYMTVKGRKKEGTLVFNAYKNSKRLGKQEVKISNALRNIIQKWMLKNPNEYLITTNTGNRIEQPRVNLMLNNIFNKNIGSSLLRHIYLTHKYGDVDLEEMEKTTQEMGNSEIERTLKYVKKNDGVADAKQQPDD
jgi:integrase